MFNLTKPIELEINASDFAFGAQIGQRNDNGKLYPITFYSHKFNGAELNYLIYDKKFLTIFNAFKEFRHYLKKSLYQVKVYINHKNITHFATIQNLNKRQLRYAEYLTKFNYIIIYRKSLKNNKADIINK